MSCILIHRTWDVTLLIPRPPNNLKVEERTPVDSPPFPFPELLRSSPLRPVDRDIDPSVARVFTEWGEVCNGRNHAGATARAGQTPTAPLLATSRDVSDSRDAPFGGPPRGPERKCAINF
jgi:hypothetical protein